MARTCQKTLYNNGWVPHFVDVSEPGPSRWEETIKEATNFGTNFDPRDMGMGQKM